MEINREKGRVPYFKPGIVKAHGGLIEPKVSAQIIYRRGTSIMWLTPKEARDFGVRLLNAAKRCGKSKNC